MNETWEYYQREAVRYAAETVALDLSALHRRFTAQLYQGAYILDAGCGSGRDSLAFLQQGYRVNAFDASPEMARLASERLQQVVPVHDFGDLSDVSVYDGIWACASLLHVPVAELPAALGCLWRSLKPGGVMYLSFKHGHTERRAADGRHFSDANESRLRAWTKHLPELASVSCWLTQSARLDTQEEWLNALLFRQAIVPSRLVAVTASNPFLPQLSAAIARADEIDFAVSFVKVSGLRLLMPDLLQAVGASQTSSDRPEPASRDVTASHRRFARIRILTSDYMDVTDPEALRLLMLLQACGADVRVYLAETGGFHLKAYLFTRRFEGGIASGTAFIGSSNISRQALTEGIEWNYRVEYPGDNGFLDVRECFDELFENWRAVALSDEWIDAYEKRRQPAARGETFLPSDKEPPPEPTAIQREALQALGNSRANGHRRGLVVLATGLGKTWLAAFDAEQMGARRVLFVAHREEILSQAADTFARIRPHSRVGFYMGQVRETAVDVLCASVQTLGKETHLERFRPDHFDYIVLDECHHAAAPTYRRLLGYFEPQFMLGLTATPDRTDQADILALCDDNLVFNRDLFTGIEAGLLAPFHYFGIWDETVDYREIPWRNGHFDPEQLTHKLATLGRARHALKEWRERAQTRTLAFCVSIRHAEFMAQKFQQAGISAAAVYGGSQMGRAEALQRLGSGQLQVVFAVDLFNEGVDLPAIDTVMLLRPTESRILFLQQLGRGLRRSPGKEQLVVLDFVGNHRTFIYKLQALMRVGPESTNVSDLMGELEHSHVSLPAGCFMNLDLALLDFVKSLHQTGDDGTYMVLREALGRRPTLLEFFRSGASPVRVRKAYGHWFGLVAAQGDLPEAESLLVGVAQAFLRELETTALTKCFKLVLLEAFQDLDGWREPPALDALAHQSRRILERRRALRGDLPAHFWADVAGAGADWQQYWMQNPVNAWVGGNQKADGRAFFAVQEGRLVPQFRLESTLIPTFTELVQEVLDYRYASYEARKPSAQGAAITTTQTSGVRVAYFPNLAIACGHFRAGCTDAETYRQLGAGHGALDPNRHFIAQAAGHSMDGGERPIRDTDHLLLETLIETNLASLAGEVVVLEQGEKSEQKEYVLREVSMQADGNVSLRAFNPTYGNLPLTEGLRPVARLRAVLNRLDLAVGESFKREEIPPLFGETFNPGNWHSGHIVLKDQKVHVLLVTLNKQGKTEAHRYLDHWIDDNTFHWQSQQSTTPQSARGCEVIEHTQRGISLHLFTREHKINDGKAAPFVYHGKVRYLKHTGSQPMNVVFDVGGL